MSKDVWIPIIYGTAFGIGVPAVMLLVAPWAGKFLDWYFPWVAAL